MAILAKFAYGVRHTGPGVTRLTAHVDHVGTFGGKLTCRGEYFTERQPWAVIDFRHDLNVILSSRVPIVLVESQDETRFLDLLKDLVRGAFGGQYRPLFRWSVTEGLQRLDIDMAPQNLNSEPTQVLKHIR